MRKRLTYANVAATLALVFAMSGGALAAKHYLITSTKQISPKVLKKLKGKTGKTGVTGKEGAQGKEGVAGKNGVNGGRGPSNGYQAFNDEVGSLSELVEPIGQVAVPAGSYLASAKLWVVNFSTERERVVCTLTNDVTGDSDQSIVTAEPKGSTPWFGRTMVTLEAASNLAVAGHWIVNCGASNEAEAKNLKIHAVQVESLSNSNA